MNSTCLVEIVKKLFKLIVSREEAKNNTKLWEFSDG